MKMEQHVLVLLHHVNLFILHHLFLYLLNIRFSLLFSNSILFLSSFQINEKMSLSLGVYF
jgi:hypothetical protein